MPADNFKHKRSPFGGKSTNILNDSAYNANAERQNGFQKSTPIHSDVVNTALKQASFVTCAVLDGLKNNAVSDFETETVVDSTTQYIDVVSAVKSLLSKQNVEQAGNVSNTINRKAITSIFEDDGVTAKKATCDGAGKNIAETYATKEYPLFSNTINLQRSAQGAMSISAEGNPTGIDKSFNLVSFYNFAFAGGQTSPLYLSREGDAIGSYCNPIFQTGDYIVEKELILQSFKYNISELKAKGYDFFQNVIKITRLDGVDKVYQCYSESDRKYKYITLKLSSGSLGFTELDDTANVYVWKLVRKSDKSEVEAVI